MRRIRLVAFVLLAAGCGLDVVGVAATDQPDAARPSVDGATADVSVTESGAPPANADAQADAGITDATVDVRDAGDGNPCASCPSGTAQLMCIANACQAVRRVFVTNAGFSGNLGGQAGADKKCSDAANAAKLGGTWLSWTTVTGNNAPQDRFTKPNVPYRLLDGTQIAANSAQLLPATDISHLDHTIDVNEKGASMDQAPESEVWTGTGIYGFGTGSDCNGWTSNKNTDQASVGHLNETGQNFTDVYNQTCDRNAQHLYCFEQ